MALTNAYCTLNQVKASLRIDVSDTIDDDLLELAINAASRDIDQATERQFYSTVATRIYTPQDSYITRIDDLVSLTTLKTSTGADSVFDVTWTATDYQLEPLNGLAGGIAVPYDSIRAVGDYTFPISGGEATVQVTGTFGFTTAPVAIQQATVLLASRIFKRNDSPGGVMGFGDIGVVRVSRIDPDIDRLIMPYKKMRFA
jgi:sporulation protein YlmC with PRC-barrel domain